ncbi:DUF5661 family protein [Bremerella sp.]|uniref:DUF5661 family protein n=1 Tax=Bremerella sp. TaxID=2795602 RepID=UPI003919DC5C
MLKRAGSTALKAKHVADSIFRQTVASIHETVANCDSGTPHEKQAVVAPRGSLTTPLAEAQQQMQAFLPGQPLQAGQGVPQTGLDGPMAQDAQTADAGVGRATAVPGMEGTAAANPIDMHGGLDPRGLALDGNHAAGVQKGFKIASLGDWLLGSVHGAAGEKEAKDQVPGGKANNKPDIAFPADEIQQGQKVEMEHTDSPAMAKEIAKDHLTESTEYYDELAKMEDKMAQDAVGRMLASLGYERTESGGVQDKYASQSSESTDKVGFGSQRSESIAHTLFDSSSLSQRVKAAMLPGKSDMMCNPTLLQVADAPTFDSPFGSDFSMPNERRGCDDPDL